MATMCFLALCSLFGQVRLLLHINIVMAPPLQAHSKFLSNHCYMRRMLLYAAVLFGGVVPVSHWFVINGGFNHPLVQVHTYVGLATPPKLWMPSSIDRTYSVVLNYSTGRCKISWFCFSVADDAKDYRNVFHHHCRRHFLHIKIP